MDKHLHYSEWKVADQSGRLYGVNDGTKALAEREAALLREADEPRAAAVEVRLCTWADRFTRPSERMTVVDEEARA